MIDTGAVSFGVEVIQTEEELLARFEDSNRVENIEAIAFPEELGLVSQDETPESEMDTGQKRIVIRCAIDN
ncbi:hypothetical protein [Nostoc sp.]|uniref:hypothetical protein n=1 Tax=Nostoc sp. TaxID=1180 RepID=UPI002FFC1FB8